MCGQVCHVLLINVGRDEGKEKDQDRWEEEQKTLADWGWGVMGGTDLTGRNAENSEVMWQERCVT